MKKPSLESLKKSKTVKTLSKKASTYVLGGGVVGALKGKSAAE